MTAAPLKTFNISENVTQVLVGGRNCEQQVFLYDKEQIAEARVTFQSSL